MQNKIKGIVKKKRQNPAKKKAMCYLPKNMVYQTYITSIHAYLQSYVDKVNKQIEANKEKSEDMQYYIDALKDKVNVLEGVRFFIVTYTKKSVCSKNVRRV